MADDDRARILDRARDETPDVLDEVVAETRDLTPEQAAARLAELGAYIRLSGRQRVEQALLGQHVSAATRALAAVSSGDTGMFDGGQFRQPNVPAGGRPGGAVDPLRARQLQARDSGLRAIGHWRDKGYLESHAADKLDGLVRRDDPTTLGAQYLAAVGDEHYHSAWVKMAAEPQTAQLRMSQEEIQAVRRVTEVQRQRDILNTVSFGGTGGFPIPLVIDPQILMTSAGVINPIRELADSATIAVETWKGVSADSPTLAYAPELTEASDNSPTLVQPVINLAKGQGFIPFSIEVGQDWQNITEELAKLLADARAIVDGTMFLTGTGAATTSGGQPGGILNIGGTGGLTTTQRVLTATTAVTALADIYSIKQAIGNSRFMANATWLFNSVVGDVFFRFVASGSTVEPQIMPQGRGGPLLGKEFREWSTMGTTTTVTGTRIAVFGDLKSFKIIDHLGGGVEFIPHIFGLTRGMPLGERGLYYFWRCGSGVTKPSGLRYLEVK